MAAQKKNSKIIMIIIIAILLIGLGTVVLYNVFFSQPKELNCKLVYEQYAEVKGNLISAEESHFNSKGYIDYNDINETLTDLCSELDSFKNSGTITEYEEEDTGVYIKLASGAGFLYTLKLNDVMPGDKLGKIITVEPHSSYSEYSLNYLLGGRSPDKAAQNISNTFSNTFKFNKKDSNYNLDSFELDDISKLTNSKIIMWYGHGGFVEEVGSVLGTSVPIDDEYTLIKYKTELANNDIILSKEYFLISPSFFANHLKNDSLKDSIIYLGSCHSGEDNRLANALINKGAKTVIGYTGTVHIRYNLYMMTDFFNRMTKTNKNGTYYNVTEALNYAKKNNGSKDKKFNSEAILFNNATSSLGESLSNSNKEAKDNQKETSISSTQTYKAKDLASKKLSEIVRIMKGRFTFEIGGSKQVYYTSPSPYIYNYNVLPGFVFFIDELPENIKNKSKVKSKIISGDYDDKFAFIALFESAQLNEQINASMNYKELAKKIGEFDCGGLAGADNYSYETSEVGERTIYLFKANEKLLNNYTGGDIKRKTLNKLNPKLQSIIVYPSKTKSISKNNSNKKITINSGDEITLSGVLFSESYEINSANKGTVSILELDKKLNCYLKDDWGYDGKTKYKIDSVQVNIDNPEEYYGKSIKIKGTVMFANTGHHLRDIVITEPEII